LRADHPPVGHRREKLYDHFVELARFVGDRFRAKQRRIERVHVGLLRLFVKSNPGIDGRERTALYIAPAAGHAIIVIES
jgi:hypothetical protein